MSSYALKANLLIGACVALLANSALADPPDDPWALLPAAPTGCYADQDGFQQTIDSALDQLNQEIDTQTGINDDVHGQLSAQGDEDPMAMAARMQEYLMNNPEEAMKMMQNLQSTGQTYSEQVTGDLEQERGYEADLENQFIQYKNAFAVLMKPIDARISRLPTVETEAGPMVSSAAEGDLRAITADANSAYQGLCGDWFQAGPFGPWLNEYRRYLVEERVPREDDVFDQGAAQLQIQGIDTANYRSTAAMTAARDYGNKLQLIYSKRQSQPFNYVRQYLDTD